MDEKRLLPVHQLVWDRHLAGRLPQFLPGNGPSPLPAVGVEGVPADGEEPGPNIFSAVILVQGLERLEKRLLGQLFGQMMVTGEAAEIVEDIGETVLIDMVKSHGRYLLSLE